MAPTLYLDKPLWRFAWAHWILDLCHLAESCHPGHRTCPQCRHSPGRLGHWQRCLAKPIALCLSPIPDLFSLPLARESAITALIITEQMLKEHLVFVEELCLFNLKDKGNHTLKDGHGSTPYGLYILPQFLKIEKAMAKGTPDTLN